MALAGGHAGIARSPAQGGSKSGQVRQGVGAVFLAIAEGEHLDQGRDLGALADAGRKAVARKAGEPLLPAQLRGEQGEVGAGLQLARQRHQRHATEGLAHVIEAAGLIPERAPEFL